MHQAPSTLKRVQAEDQIEIKGMKFVDKARTDKLFRDEPEEPSELN